MRDQMRAMRKEMEKMRQEKEATAKSTEEQRKAVNDAAADLAAKLKKAGIRAQADLREGYTPGYKFNDWEQKASAATQSIVISRCD